MILDEKLVSSLILEDVRSLISESACESHRLEYKRDWWGGNDEDRREMLRDISSMANANGGFFVVGIETVRDSGPGDLECPVSIVGLDVLNYSERITRSVRDNLDPPCRGIEIVQIESDGGRAILVIQVPQSLDAPHMVTFKGLNQFWQRHGTDKQPMSTQEIRNQFANRLSYRDQLQEFAQREILLLESDFEVPKLLYMWAAPIVPLLTEIDVKSSELRALFGNNLLNQPFGHDLYCGTTFPTLNGIEAEERRDNEYRFIRLHRNGFFEIGIDRLMGKTGDTNDIHAFAASAYMYNFADLMIKVFRELGTQSPVAMGAAFVNVANFKLFVGSYTFSHLSDSAWKTTTLNLGHRIAYDFENEKPTILRELSDRLWNAFHFDQCPFWVGDTFQPPGR